MGNAPAPLQDPFELVGSLLDGKHRVDRVIAIGGFGVVYAGHHVRLDVPIAIKVLKPLDVSPEQRGEAVIRFIEEARTTARLRHPHIAQVLDTGIAESMRAPEGVAWMVLEWLDGDTLAGELERRRGRGGRSPRQCWRLIRPILEAVAYAHEAGVVHRDLKPSNVMLSVAGSGVIVKVLDFGIAKVIEGPEGPATGDTTTQSAFSAFSPGYAAPEQIARTRTGPWTDVHALGMILSELLTDSSPYPAKSSSELFAMAFDPERPTPRRFGVDAGEWEPIIARALSIKPSERHASARELFDALAATLDGAESRRVSLPTTAVELSSPTTAALSVTAPTQRDIAPTWQDAPPSSATVPASTVTAQPPRPRTAAWMVAIGGVVLGLGAAGLVVGINRSRAEQPLVQTPTSSALPAAPVVISALAASPDPMRTTVVSVEPADAEVSIAGEKRASPGGRLELSGKLGSVHRVRIARGGQSHEQDVWITESGARPDKLVLPAAAPSAAVDVQAPRRPPPPTPSATVATQPSGRLGTTPKFD